MDDVDWDFPSSYQSEEKSRLSCDVVYVAPFLRRLAIAVFMKHGNAATEVMAKNYLSSIASNNGSTADVGS